MSISRNLELPLTKGWNANMKSSKFTQRFNGYMFEDNSLSKESKLSLVQKRVKIDKIQKELRLRKTR